MDRSRQQNSTYAVVPFTPNSFVSLPSSQDWEEKETDHHDITGPLGSILSRNASQRGKDLVYEELANKQIPRDRLDMVKRSFIKQEDSRIRMTYDGGKRLPEVVDHAPVLKVAIYFVPGADTPQVNRLEKGELIGESPDQKSATWRAYTAAALLSEFEVRTDLSIVEKDYKETMGTIIASAKKRRTKEDPLASATNALTIRDKSGDPDHLVTIDSDEVHIVRDLSEASWDIQSTCIEVDGSSLMNLMVNYRELINREGANAPLEPKKTIALLETIIEDARRLFIRSPILSRMSNRYRIINSRNTRYGIDDGVMFRTLTTSKGIAQMISWGTSYYSALDGYGKMQEEIRPKFLQTVVLLLSLLNDNDLKQLEEFLESTYGLKAERKCLEVTFLKVLPLMSLNSKIFITGLLSAYENQQIVLKKNTEDTRSFAWDVFIGQITALGYILPGTAEQVGREHASWKVKWAEYKDSSVFNDLQYGGTARSVNEIPSLMTYSEASDEDVSAILTNGQKYTMGSKDLEMITFTVKGRYTINDAATSQSYDLEIDEKDINHDIYSAVRAVNEISSSVNSYFARPDKAYSSGNVLQKLRRASGNGNSASKGWLFYTDIKASGRLTRNVAMLGDEMIAVTYKLDGRKITKRDLMRNMNADMETIKDIIGDLEATMSDVNQTRTIVRTYRGVPLGPELKDKIMELRKALHLVRKMLETADAMRKEVESFPSHVGDEPVTRVFYPNHAGHQGDGKAGKVWSDYRTALGAPAHAGQVQIGEQLPLFVEAKRFVVDSVSWAADTAEIMSQDGRVRAFVTPLTKLQDEADKEDEVRKGDSVILAGGLAMILDAAAQLNESMGTGGLPSTGYGEGESVVNYMRLTGLDGAQKSRRWQNRKKDVLAQTILR